MDEEQVQKLIDKAIAKHNRSAGFISAVLGAILLFFYAQGVIILVGK